jgi:hypothetical protein
MRDARERGGEMSSAAVWDAASVFGVSGGRDEGEERGGVCVESTMSSERWDPLPSMLLLYVRRGESRRGQRSNCIRGWMDELNERFPVA